MLVALLMAVHNANATARLALGRGMVEEIQERISWKIENEPMAWRNMALKNRCQF